MLIILSCWNTLIVLMSSFLGLVGENLVFQPLKNTFSLFCVACVSIIYGCLISYIFKLKARLKNLQQEKTQLKSLVDRDGFTGLYNRAAGEQLLKKILSRKTTQFFGVLFLDIDHFKNINDNFGHLVGDQALLAMIQSCLPQLRKDDVFIRWGGEEFVIIARGSDKINLMILAERLRVEIARIKFKDNNISMTASFGVTLSSHNDTVHSLISRVDHALYRAKDSGRNQVYFS